MLRPRSVTAARLLPRPTKSPSIRYAIAIKAAPIANGFLDGSLAAASASEHDPNNSIRASASDNLRAQFRYARLRLRVTANRGEVGVNVVDICSKDCRSTSPVTRLFATGSHRLI